MKTKKVVEIIQGLYALKKIIQGIKEETSRDPYISNITTDELVNDAYSIVISLIGELEKE